MRGYVSVLWHRACASSLIQLWMLNKQEKVGENNHPWVNMRQYKGFKLQLTNVVLFFAGNRVAAYLSVLNSSKIPLKGKSMHDNELRTTGSSAFRLSYSTKSRQEIEPFFFPLTFSQWAAFHLKQWEDPSYYPEPKPKHTLKKNLTSKEGTVPATNMEVC